jgi:molybdopterin-guanine dinucleotide biosynthesis protein A
MGGGDKGLIELAGRPILEHVIERLRPQVDGMAINANGDPARFACYGLPVLADTVPGFPGPLAGVLAGLEWACSRGCRWVTTIATDTPFFPRDLVQRLSVAIREQSAEIACVASAGRAHPVIGLWPARLAPELKSALMGRGVRKVDEWTQSYRLVEVDFPVLGYDPFFNANRREDLDEARRILSELQT